MNGWTAVLAASAVCFAVKLLGYVAPPRWLERPRVARVSALVTVALLAALVAVQTAAADRAVVVDARVPALAVAVLALLLRAPFVVVVEEAEKPGNLGAVLLVQGKLMAARVSLDQALRVAENHLGSYHPTVSVILIISSMAGSLIPAACILGLASSYSFLSSFCRIGAIFSGVTPSWESLLRSTPMWPTLIR